MTMIDWLVWGAAQASGLLFKPILEDLAKDAAKDWVKDMFKGCLSNVAKLPEKEPLDIAAGKALKEFLAFFQLELEDGELEEDQVKEFLNPLKKFISIKDVREILGCPFQDEVKGIDVTSLDKLWKAYRLKELPDSFNWETLSQRYTRKVKAILQENPQLREILKAQNLERIADNTESIPVDYDLIAYKETLETRYKHLPIDGLPDPSIQERRIPLWDIFIEQKARECREYLPRVYELPKDYQSKLTKEGQLREYSLEELERFQQVYSSQMSYPVLDFIEPAKNTTSSSALTVIRKTGQKRDNHYYVILGDPGAGKSTLLKYLAIRWTKLSTRELTVEPIPLLIELRDYVRAWEHNECQDFLAFIHKSSEWVGHLNQHRLHETLKSGNAVVMFDGLDEVFDPQQRKTVIKQIQDLTKDYPKIKVIVTSRVIGYESSALRDAHFTHYMIQDLEPEQIDDFSQKWHDLTCDNQGDKERYKKRLKAGITNSRAIQQLSSNPLLLTMMAILNRSQELPRDRAELYKRCSEILLYQWDINRGLVEDKRIDPKVFDYKDKQAMCRKIAYFMQSNQQGLAGNIISEEDLEGLLQSYLRTIDVEHPREITRVMIHQLRYRNFMLCSLGGIGKEGHYGFVHRTFLEYFCAWEFVWKFEKDKTLEIEELKAEVFRQHWQDETWHEVLRLICGMIEPKFTGEIIEDLMSLEEEEKNFMNLFLAADCLNEVRNRQDIRAIDEFLLQRIKYLVDYKDEWVRGKDNEVKATLILDRLKSTFQKIAMVWQDIYYLKTCASDKSWVVRVRSIEQLAQQFKDDPDTLDILKNSAIYDEYRGVRVMAIVQLAQQFKDEPDLFKLLSEWAVKAPFQRQYDWEINPREIALRYLVELFPDHPQLKAILQERLNNDLDEKVREYVQSVMETINQIL